MAPDGSLRLALRDDFKYIHGVGRLVEAEVPELVQGEVRRELVERLQHSAGGAALVAGFRGVGKTATVEAALQQLASAIEPDKIVITRLDIARPLSSTDLLFQMMRRMVDALDDSSCLDLLDETSRAEILLAYTRTSMSITRKTERSRESTSTVGLGADFAINGQSPIKFSPNLERATKSGRTDAVEASFLGYSEADVEADFVRIVKTVTSRPHRGRRSSIFRKREPARSFRLVVVLDELDKLTAIPEGRDAFNTILATLRNVLIVPGLHVILNAGVDVLDASQMDRLAGSGIYEGAFSWETYVPCTWNAADRLLMDMGVESSALVTSLTGFLDYKSRGVLRRLFQEFNRFAKFDEQGPCIRVAENEIDRVSLYARLNQSLQRLFSAISLNASVGVSADRQQMSCFYVTDWMLRTQGDVFTVTDILSGGAMADLVPNPEVIESLVNHLHAEGFLEELAGNGLGVSRLAGGAAPEPLFRLSESLRGDLMHVARSNDRERAFLLAPRPGRDYSASRNNPAALPASVDPATTMIRPRRIPPAIGESVPNPAAKYETAIVLDSIAVETPPDFALPTHDRTLGDGRYELEDILGAGGVSVVYRATDVRMGEPVAIKMLRPGLISSLAGGFRREGEMQRMLKHPGIPRVLDLLFDEPDGRLAIVTEIVGLPSLSEVLAQEVNMAKVPRLGLALLDVIGYCHDLNMFSLDLKPDNIRAAPDFAIVKVLDLCGTAVLSESAISSPPMIGTPVYMAPEQLVDRPIFGKPVDFYSLGLILFQAAGGRLTAPSSIANLLQERLSGNFSVDELRCSPQVKGIISGLLATSPEERLTDVQMIARALRATPECAEL